MTRSASEAPLEWKGTPRYDVVGCLGQGGMGVVYEAFDQERRSGVDFLRFARRSRGSKWPEPEGAVVVGDATGAKTSITVRPRTGPRDRDDDQWSRVTARILEASIENAVGNRDAARAALRAAIAGVAATDMHLYSAMLHYRLGELLAGEEGRDLVANASENLAAEGIREPRRWVPLYFPGHWGTR